MNSRLQKQLIKKVEGKNIIITGASSGIGLSAAKQLANAGAHVILMPRTKEKLDEVKA